MKKIVFLAVSLFFMVFAIAQDAKEIVKNADEMYRGKSNYSEMSLEVIRPKWTRKYSMKSWSKGNDYSLVVITAPASDKGQAFLKREKDLWNWQPSINRMIKMPPSMMSQGWMGSDISNDDLMRQSSLVADYTHLLEKQEAISGYNCHKIVLTPLEDADVIWGKIIMWISEEGYMIMKAEYFDDEEDLVHTELASEVKVMDGRKIPTKFKIIPADDENNVTVLYFNSIDFDIDIDESFFSQQKMKSLR